MTCGRPSKPTGPPAFGAAEPTYRVDNSAPANLLPCSLAPSAPSLDVFTHSLARSLAHSRAAGCHLKCSPQHTSRAATRCRLGFRVPAPTQLWRLPLRRGRARPRAVGRGGGAWGGRPGCRQRHPPPWDRRRPGAAEALGRKSPAAAAAAGEWRTGAVRERRQVGSAAAGGGRRGGSERLLAAELARAGRRRAPRGGRAVIG